MKLPHRSCTRSIWRTLLKYQEETTWKWKNGSTQRTAYIAGRRVDTMIHCYYNCSKHFDWDTREFFIDSNEPAGQIYGSRTPRPHITVAIYVEGTSKQRQIMVIQSNVWVDTRKEHSAIKKVQALYITWWSMKRLNWTNWNGRVKTKSNTTWLHGQINKGAYQYLTYILAGFFHFYAAS